jgi:dUTP pyrophosphatase
MSDTQLKKRKMSPSENFEQESLAPVSQLLVKRVSDKGKLPTRGSPLSAGYDLYRYVSNKPEAVLDNVPLIV